MRSQSDLGGGPMSGQMSISAVEANRMHLTLGGRCVEVALHSPASAIETILLLHEALGSVSYWRDFPQKLALATGARVLAYSRPGHGSSEGPPEMRNEEHYLRQIEEVIPALLQHFGLSDPILYGHSEGASIALLYAASSNRVKALLLESPHIVAERSTYLHIRKMAVEYPGSKLQQALARYHQEADAVFESWIGWATTATGATYPLLDLLANIDCPVLALQGAEDDFGTRVHLEALQAVLPNLEYEVFANTGHLPHREQTDLLLNWVARFVTGLQ